MGIEGISSIVGKYMSVLALVVAAVTLLWPDSGLWIQTKWVNDLLILVMFGMGLSLRASDFKVVFEHPKFLFVACIAQFTIMPVLAYVLGTAFGLGTGLMIGVILVGCCPGGTASNVMTYLAKGDVALSVGMTAVNTVVAPVLTPLLVYFYLNKTVDVNLIDLFTQIIEIVVIPLAVGFLITHFFGKQVSKVKEGVPLISVIAILLIIAAVVSHNSAKILSSSIVIFVVVVLHNLLGYLGGYLVGMALKAPLSQKKAHSIEIGMQNSGLATTLAIQSFPLYPMAAVPGAIFSVWHNISGAILANIFSRMKDDQEEKKD